ncbi:MAG: DUF1328 domain-containing protein [Pseudomonadales bacterium]|nr:DUF1328 domain-containing protein [Pseudomonadales bacterium]
MFHWALMFLIVAIIAGVLGLPSVAVIASEVSWIFFVVGLILSVLLFVMGRLPPL